MLVSVECAGNGHTLLSALHAGLDPLPCLLQRARLELPEGSVWHRVKEGTPEQPLQCGSLSVRILLEPCRWQRSNSTSSLTSSSRCGRPPATRDWYSCSVWPWHRKCTWTEPKGKELYQHLARHPVLRRQQLQCLLLCEETADLTGPRTSCRTTVPCHQVWSHRRAHNQLAW